MSIKSAIYVSVLCLAATTASRADIFKFVQTGPQTATFSIDSSSPLGSVTPGHGFSYTDTDGNEVDFFNISGGGGYDNFEGPQLYIHPETNPSLLPGTYLLFHAGDFDTDTLVITDTTVPEPSSFALLGTGLAAFGSLARRKSWLRSRAHQA